MKRVALLAALVAALTAAPGASAFHHRFVPGGECGQSPNAGGGNPTAIAAIRAHNPAQGQSLPLPPAGTPANPNATPVECPAPQK